MIRQEILILSSSLNSKNTCQLLDINNIYDFVENFNPDDFIEQKKCQLKFQLQHYKHNVFSSRSTRLVNNFLFMSDIENY